jgi:hypothetical protein
VPTCRLAETADAIGVGPGQLVGEQHGLAELYGLVAPTTDTVEQQKNQIRDTSAIRSPRGRLNWRFDPTDWAMRPVRLPWRRVCFLERRAACPR